MLHGQLTTELDCVSPYTGGTGGGARWGEAGAMISVKCEYYKLYKVDGDITYCKYLEMKYTVFKATFLRVTS